MKRKLTYLLPGLALLVALPATSAEAPAPEAVRAIVVEDADEELKLLNDAVKEAQEAFMKRYREAAPEDQEAMRPEYYAIGDSFADRFLALAKAHAETEAASKAIDFVVRQSTVTETRSKAVELFLAHHADTSEAVFGMARDLAFSRTAGTSAVVRTLLKHEPLQTEPFADAKAMGTYALAMQLKNDSAAAESDEAREKLTAEYLALLESCTEFEIEIAPNYKTIAAAAKGELFEVQHLQIGMVAPDIEGEDLDGVNFKLSDYRGKVVMLDFWGDW